MQNDNRPQEPLRPAEEEMEPVQKSEQNADLIGQNPHCFVHRGRCGGYRHRRVESGGGGGVEE